MRRRSSQFDLWFCGIISQPKFTIIISERNAAFYLVSLGRYTNLIEGGVLLLRSKCE
jgi:hypothetical protein